MWDNKKVKIKQNTLCNDYQECGSNSVDIEHLIANLNGSWVKRLYTESFPEWKIIPLQYINKLFDKYSNPKNNLSLFPSFYKDIP